MLARGVGRRGWEGKEGQKKYRAYIFESIEILVALIAVFALVGLFLLHAHFTRIRCGCLRVDDGEGSIPVFVQLLGLVTVLFVISALSISDKTREAEKKMFLEAGNRERAGPQAKRRGKTYLRPFWFL
jgi:uncharacterized membrane protein